MTTGERSLTAAAGATTPVVRPAVPGEHPTIRTLVGLAYAQSTTDLPAAAWNAFRADLLDLDRHARHGRLLVATVAGEICGYTAFYPAASVQGLGRPPGPAGVGWRSTPAFGGTGSPPR